MESVYATQKKIILLKILYAKKWYIISCGNMYLHLFIFDKNIYMLNLELRSDTFTKPTPEMLQAMFSAKVGDDVFGEDETTNALETKTAKLFGYEAGLFCMSGTMANQIAIKVHTQPGDEVICDALSHIYLYEGGGIASNSLASVQLLHGDKGRITAQQVLENIKVDNVHYPISKLVSLENTVNKGGGCVYDIGEIKKIKQVCLDNHLQLHLDGARIFNALAYTTETPTEHGVLFNSMSVCLSKGLGAPMGSVLLGTTDFIHRARRVRKRMGGGWRQSGYLASAGIYALDKHVDRLSEDHRRAQELGKLFATLPQVKEIFPIQTNIVILELHSKILAKDFVAILLQKDIKVSPFGKHQIRLVTHLDFGDDELQACASILKNIQ
jgi:threonine aldolase